jgi:hypothetical protein
MKRFRSPNNTAVCKPYSKTGLTMNTKTGFARIDQKTRLYPLEVLVEGKVGSEWLNKNDILYVKQQDLEVQKWAVEVQDLNGEACILVPMSYVVLIEEELEIKEEEPRRGAEPYEVP